MDENMLQERNFQPLQIYTLLKDPVHVSVYVHAGNLYRICSFCHAFELQISSSFSLMLCVQMIKPCALDGAQRQEERMKEHRQLALRLESPAGRCKITIWKMSTALRKKINKTKPSEELIYFSSGDGD